MNVASGATRFNWRRGLPAFAIIIATCFLVSSFCPAAAQPVQDSLMSKEEQARSIERDIASLEAQLVRAKADVISVAQRLSEVEKLIVNCYAEIDAAKAEVDGAKQRLSFRLRSLYVDGGQTSLVQLLTSRDVSDFLAGYEDVMSITARELDAFKVFKAKKNHLEEVQGKLVQFKREQAKLTQSADTQAIEGRIAEKQGELALVTSTLISLQVPSTFTPASVTFDPARIYARPDDNAFTRTGQTMSGYSSWYGDSFNGKSTASGEVFDQYAYTCAHKTLPFGTWLRVTFRGRSVIVKVNDRGPAVPGRMLDLSRGAAEAVGLTGVQWVDCEIVVPRT